MYRHILRTLYIGWLVHVTLSTPTTIWYSSDNSWDFRRVSIGGCLLLVVLAVPRKLEEH